MAMINLKNIRLLPAFELMAFNLSPRTLKKPTDLVTLLIPCALLLLEFSLIKHSLRLDVSLIPDNDGDADDKGNKFTFNEVVEIVL